MALTFHNGLDQYAREHQSALYIADHLVLTLSVPKCLYQYYGDQRVKTFKTSSMT